MLEHFPGGDIVERGLADLAGGIDSEEALLVAVGAPRLRALGFEVRAVEDAEHRLYELIARRGTDAAHSRYNALIRRLVSFERAVECARRQTRVE